MRSMVENLSVPDAMFLNVLNYNTKIIRLNFSNFSIFRITTDHLFVAIKFTVRF